MSKRQFRYTRTDFQPLPVKLTHMDIHLSFLDDEVEGGNTLRMTAQKALSELRLDARDLDVRAVDWLEDDGSARAQPLDYEVEPAQHALRIRLPEQVAPGQTFTIRTRTVCVPSETILEGIYKDTTPAGAPQQYMSQCQQWGFQRILPVLDDCTAKCTMVTTLEADARYTHLISNGNISRAHNPAGTPVPKPGDASRQVMVYENDIPMAPYLFICCVGTWDVLEDEVVYPSGRRVQLEYLVPPGRTADAVVPMAILKESILWQGRTQGYEYTRDVYRTLCMEKSNFGGMENVGNTTIITSAALIDAYTTDRRLEYAHGVIVHEFEHNQCGSDVTMETPFDMWLNEAYTVDVERAFLMSQFDPDAQRLSDVDAMRAPLSGPLAIEDGGHMGRIVRDGFNDPDELVDGVTYVKAAEVIRMLGLILGSDVFRQGKDLYFRRYNGGNANTDQFFACFEECSGRDLTVFKQEWLHTIGYPKVAATYDYDAAARRLRITFRQSRAGTGGLFHLPLAMAAVDEQGREIPGTVRIVELTGETAEVTIEDVPAPAFLSCNRDCSFYGTFTDRSATVEQLEQQVRLDPDGFARVEAMRHLTDRERIRLLHDLSAPVGGAWLELFASLVRDESIHPGLNAYLLRIDESSLDRAYLPFYRERCAAHDILLGAAATHAMADLMAAYERVDTYRHGETPRDGVDERHLKGVLLRTITEAGTAETWELAETHFRKAWNISDRMSALVCVDRGGHPDRLALLDEARELWNEHLPAYTSYLGIVAGSPHEDVFARIADEEQRPPFRLEHPGHSRGLFLPMAMNNKRLWTDRGIEWVADTVVRLAPVNENTANRLVACFRLVDKLADDLKPKVVSALTRMRDSIDEARAPSTAGRVRAYLGE